MEKKSIEFKGSGCYMFLLIVSLLQVNVTYHSLLVKELREVSGVDETTIGRVVNSVSLRVKYFSKVFLV